MPRIPDEIIEQVRDAADLLEIVQEQVTLKRTGNDWRGPCPFHGGSHRNFAVIPRQNRYYGFVCHATGDVFTWYRDRFGMDYPTAVREAARRWMRGECGNAGAWAPTPPQLRKAALGIVKAAQGMAAVLRRLATAGIAAPTDDETTPEQRAAMAEHIAAEIKSAA